MTKMKKFIVIFTALFITSCSSIKSIEMPLRSQMGGLSYYMPKKDLVVKVKVDQGQISEVTFEESLVYPDLSKPYMLKFAHNAMGKNTLKVGITKEGLLTSVSSTTISDVSDIIGSIGTNAGNVKGLSPEKDAKKKKPLCHEDGDYVFVYPIPSVTYVYTPCGNDPKFTIAISRLTPDTESFPHSKEESKSHSGIFYRQNEPYKVTASSKKVNASDIIYSPSNSETSFIPIAKTVFANNKADFSFTDGMITKYEQDVDGEVLALLQTPAKVVAGYFSAIGQVFDGFSTTDTKEIAMMNKSLELQIAKEKYINCSKAVGNKELMNELGCN